MFHRIYAVLTVLGVGLLSAGPAQANNAKCWGHGVDDTSRDDISCTSLTESFLIKMRGATPQQVVAAMGAGGMNIKDSDSTTIHYLGNAGYGSGWGGVINFIFENGRVSIIRGSIDGPDGTYANTDYIWNIHYPHNGGLYCSNFPGSRNLCK